VISDRWSKIADRWSCLMAWPFSQQFLYILLWDFSFSDFHLVSKRSSDRTIVWIERSMYHLVYNLNTAINKQTSQMSNNCNLPYFCRLYADR